jgi:EAL and modified HD-GYP domain-containing signal transduction protein
LVKPALFTPIADMYALAEGEGRIRMTPVTDQTRESETLHVARQPILDERGRVFGYELLYRRAASDVSCMADGDLASARVLTSAVLDLGLDTLTSGRLAFLNVTRSLLLGQIDTLIPPEGVVLELLETVAVDKAVIEVCRDLRSRGYRLALDDFVAGSEAEALLPHVSFVKVDVLNTPADVVKTLGERLARDGLRLLAEKVESRDTYEHTRSAGYSLFQGYYFCRPVVQSGAALPAQKLAYLRLLAELSKPDLMTADVEKLVKRDVSLSLRVLRSVNSAGYAIRTEIRSIGQALVLLGIEPIRKWTTVWCLAGLSAGATTELATLSLLRARTCELLGESSSIAESAELFLVGLFSLLDVMLSRPMSEAVDGLPLSAGAMAALLGEPNTLRSVVDAVIAHERGEWNDAASLAEASGLQPSALADAYTNALRWVQDAAHAM